MLTLQSAKLLKELALDLQVRLANREQTEKEIAAPVADSIDRARRKRAIKDLENMNTNIERIEKQIRQLVCG